MKHIVLIIDSLAGGGAEKVVLTLAEAIAKLKHRVTLIALSHVKEHHIPDNIDITIVERPKSLLAKVFKRRCHAKALQRTLDSLNSEQPINLIVSNLPTTDRITRYLKGYNIYFCIHNNYTSEFLAHRSGFSLWQKRHKLRSLYNNKKIIAVSQGIVDDFSQSLNIKTKCIAQIYNPFAIQSIRNQADIKIEGLQEKYLIHIGRINRQKRHDRLLQAFKNSKASRSYKLLLLGGGSPKDIDKLQHIISSLQLEGNVIYHGFEKNPFPYIKGAEALVLSSDFEGFGNVLIESLICGTPVVSTDCPSGPNEILTDTLTEFLAPLNEQALADAIDKVIEKPPVISEELYTRFSDEYIAAQYIALAT